ncbi:MAG TPA: hypothetical protein VHA73_00110 [Acidimicrobiales bacterium]|jgi:lysophospholipase L1-like esterase|nr:hypothetical protein [Acidimicrobiales bacterium]
MHKVRDFCARVVGGAALIGVVAWTLVVSALAAPVAAARAVPGQTPPSSRSTTTTPTTAATTTTGAAASTTAPGTPKKLLIVGDSVIKGVEVYGQLPTLQAALPGYAVTFDAEESRSTVGGAGVILSRNPAQFDTVIVSLGTNDAGSPEVFKGRVKTVLDELKAVPHVFWTTVHERGRYAKEYTASNLALDEVAGQYPNTKVIDWNAFANTLAPAELAGDGLHLLPASAKAMATLLAQSVLGTTPYSRSTAPTTTAPPTTASATTGSPTTTASSSGSGSSSKGWLIGIVVGAVLLVGFLAAAVAGWRRSKARRREERKARLDKLFGPSGSGDLGAPPGGEVAWTPVVASLDDAEPEPLPEPEPLAEPELLPESEPEAAAEDEVAAAPAPAPETEADPGPSPDADPPVADRSKVLLLPPSPRDATGDPATTAGSGEEVSDDPPLSDHSYTHDAPRPVAAAPADSGAADQPAGEGSDDTGIAPVD